MPLVGIWRREEQWSGTWRCEGALNSRSMLGCALGCRWECPALPVACRRRLLSWLFGRALPHSPVNHAKAEREKSSAGLPACGEREHASLRQGQQGVAVLHFLKMRREAQRGKGKGKQEPKIILCVHEHLCRLASSALERDLWHGYGKGNGPAMDTGVRTGQGRGGQPRRGRKCL